MVWCHRSWLVERPNRRYLSYLNTGRGAPANVILTAPRGNGKTALLRSFERDIKDGKKQPDVVWLTPDDILTLDALAAETVPPTRFGECIPDHIKVSVVGGEFSWNLAGRSGSFTKLLAARCQIQPLVLLLDEAARVAEAFAGTETMREHELDAIIAAALPPGSGATQTDRCRKQIGKLGYVWNPPEADDIWQPGIPSLMTYMQER